MKVDLLRQFLHSLAVPLQTLGVADKLDEACQALAHFQDMELDLFVHFLKQAEALQKSNPLATPTAHSMAVDKLDQAHQAVQSAASSAHFAGIAGLQEETRQQLELLARSAGISGALKIDAKWASDLVAKHEREQWTGRVQALADRIVASGTFDDAGVTQEIDALSAVPPKQIKDAATARGVKISGKTAKALLVQLLEKISGIPCVYVDLAAVQLHVQTLMALYDQSVDTPPKAEIEAEMTRIKKRNIAEIQRIATEFGIESPGSDKKAIIKRIKGKITASSNAKKANEI